MVSSKDYSELYKFGKVQYGLKWNERATWRADIQKKFTKSTRVKGHITNITSENFIGIIATRYNKIKAKDNKKVKSHTRIKNVQKAVKKINKVNGAMYTCVCKFNFSLSGVGIEYNTDTPKIWKNATLRTFDDTAFNVTSLNQYENVMTHPDRLLIDITEQDFFRCNLTFDIMLSGDNNKFDNEVYVYYYMNEKLRNHINGENSDSDLNITNLKYTLSKIPKTNIKNIQMKQITYMEPILENLQGEYKDKNDGLCVLNYITHELKNYRYKKPKNIDVLKEQMTELDINWEDGISISEIVDYCYARLKNVRIRAYDHKGLLSQSDNVNIILNDNHYLNLNFIICNKHIYPLLGDVIKGKFYNKSAVVKELKIPSMYIYNHKGTNDYITCENYENVINGSEDKLDIYICGSEYNIISVMCDVIRTNKIMVDHIITKRENIYSFIHPVSKKTICVDDKYNERKELCEILKNEISEHDFIFNNQPYSKIVNDIFFHKVGNIKPSLHNERAISIYNNHNTPIIIRNYILEDDITDDFLNRVKVVDLCKSYPSAIMMYNYNIPAFGYLDNFEKYDGKKIVIGEYLIDNHKLPFNSFLGGNVKLNGGVYSYGYVLEMMKLGYIEKKHIIKVRKASKYISIENIKGFVKFCYDKLGEAFKNTILSWIGCMNRSKYEETTTSILTDEEYIDSLIFKYMESEYYASKKKIDTDNEIDLFTFMLTKENDTQEKTNGNMWRHIVSMANLQIIKLLKSCYGRNTVVCALKTDSVTLLYMKPPKEFAQKKDLECEFGRYKFDKFKLTMKKINCETMNIIDDFEYCESDGIFTYGQGGVGKSTKNIKIIEKIIEEMIDGKILLCSMSNQVKVMLKNMIKEKNIEIDIKTFDSAITPNEKQLLKYDVIIYDEVFMASSEHLKILYEMNYKYNKRIICSGDKNQLPPIGYAHNLIENEAFLSMFSEIEELQYIEGKNRFNDNETLNFLKEFVETKEIKRDFKKRVKCMTNLSMYNRTRRRINNRILDKVKGEELTFKYAGKKEKYKIFDKMKIICTKNDIEFKELDIVNSTKATLKISGDKYYIVHENQNIEISKEKLRTCFLPSYCTTVHKFQGGKIEENYNIFDVEHFNFNMMYTALSRGTNINLVHMEGDYKRVYKPFNYKTQGQIEIKPTKPITYFYHNKKENKIEDVHIDGENEIVFKEEMNNKDNIKKIKESLELKYCNIQPVKKEIEMKTLLKWEDVKFNMNGKRFNFVYNEDGKRKEIKKTNIDKFKIAVMTHYEGKGFCLDFD